MRFASPMPWARWRSLHASEGNFDDAEALFERSLALSRKQGNPNNIAANLCNLALGGGSPRCLRRARRTSLLEALTIAEDIGESRWGSRSSVSPRRSKPPRTNSSALRETMAPCARKANGRASTPTGTTKC